MTVTARFFSQLAWIAVTGISLFVGACTNESGTVSSPPVLGPVASIQELMVSVVDPAADHIWKSVATIATPDGVEERRPRSLEEWDRLRLEVVRLVESSNLLLAPDLEVARPGFRPESPDIELEPNEIRTRINDDRQMWNRLVADFAGASVTILNAVDRRDIERLFDEGGRLDLTCERCHRQFWYRGAGGVPRIPSMERDEPSP